MLYNRIINNLKKIPPSLLYHEINTFIKKIKKINYIQSTILKEHLKHSENSAYGKLYKFSKIQNTTQFKNIVPIVKYENIKPYIDQVFEGNISALFNPNIKIKMFNITSGTTGPKKFIPITNRAIKFLKQGFRIWGIKTLYDHPSIIGSKFAPLVSSSDQLKSPMGVPCGDAGGLFAEIQPSIISNHYPIPFSVYAMNDNDAKFYLYLRFLLPYKNLKFLITPTPATFVALYNYFDSYKTNLIKDIYDGSCHIQDIKHSHFKFSPNPKRAKEIEKICNQKSKIVFADIWPQLELLSCWTGGNFKHYKKTLKSLFGTSCSIRDIGFTASEGHFSIPLKDDVSYGVLNLAHYYFEFIPQEDYPPKDYSTTLDVCDIQQDKNYYLIITNACGLFRYDMQDLIKFIGFENDVPIIEFLSKASHFIDISGEKVSSYQITQSINETMQYFDINDVSVQEFVIYPKINNPSYYVLVVEKGSIKNPNISKLFIEKFDQILQTNNMVYKEHRGVRKLGMIKLKEISPKGWIQIKHKYQRHCTQNIEQYKMPRIINDPNFDDFVNSLKNDSL